MSIDKKILLDMMVLTESIKRVRDLHAPEEQPSEITNKTYCAECQYEYPCLTIKMLDGVLDGV